MKFTKHIILSLFILSFLSEKTMAQCSGTYFEPRTRQLTEYFLNQPIYNPAFAGQSNLPTIGIATRVSNSPILNGFNIDLQPFSVAAFAHGNLNERVGIGLMVNYDDFRDGADRRTLQLGVMQNYLWELGEDLEFRLGLNASLLHYRSFCANINGFFNPAPVLPRNEANFKFNTDIGVLIKYKKALLGLSINHANEPQFQFFSNTTERFRRETYITASYELDVIENVFTVVPSLMLNTLVGNRGFYNFSRNYTNLNILLKYKEIGFVGLSYKTQDMPYEYALTIGGRVADTWQLSTTFNFKNNDLVGSSINDYSRIEASLGIFLNRADEGYEVD